MGRYVGTYILLSPETTLENRQIVQGFKNSCSVLINKWIGTRTKYQIPTEAIYTATEVTEHGEMCRYLYSFESRNNIGKRANRTRF